MPFFKDIGGYKVSEFRNGTVNRVVVESVMAEFARSLHGKKISGVFFDSIIEETKAAL